MRVFGLIFCLLWQTFPASFRQHVKAAPKPVALTSTDWATTYLFNTLFLYEYWFIKRLQQDASLSINLQAKFPPLIKRAEFATYAIRTYQQPVPHLAMIAKEIELHKKKLKMRASPMDSMQNFQLRANALAKTFAQPFQQKLASILMVKYQGLSPELPCPSELLRKMAKQETAFALFPKTKELPAATVTAQGFCQAVYLLTELTEISNKKEKPERKKALQDKVESLWLSPVATSQEMLLLQTVWHLIRGAYPSSLHLLMTLQAKEGIYRLAYDQVQRLYSLNEKGSGRVALQGI